MLRYRSAPLAPASRISMSGPAGVAAARPGRPRLARKDACATRVHQPRWFTSVLCLGTVDAMPLNADLLQQTKTAEARVIDAEQAADIARAEFHGAVRRLQLAGASLREIAETLGLSHQRVHQIVEGAGGSRRWRRHRASSNEQQFCSFCGHGKEQEEALVYGPGVSICDRCISRVHEVLAVTERRVSTPIAIIQQVDDGDRAERCSFCGKRRRQVSAMASAGHTRICDECLELCQEIRSEGLN